MQVALNGIVLGSTIALVALGFTLLFGVLRIVNFAHGTFYMLGAVIAFYVMQQADISFTLASAIAVGSVGLLGWVTDRFIMHRFHGNLMGGMIASIALMLGVQELLYILWGPVQRGVPSVVTGMIEAAGVVISAERILTIVISIAAILGLTFFIRRSRLGKAMRATQQDSEAASTLGINTYHICGITFAIATGLAALAGVLQAPVTTIHPGIGTLPLYLAFIVVILGGLGSIPGTLTASFIIGLQQSFTATYWRSEFTVAASFALAMIILLVRPKGLMGNE
jgi:branched-chain amino acid transport system permease protein